MSKVLVHALVPTARAVTWTPLFVATAGLLALAALLRAQDATSPAVLSLGAGTTAAAVVYALRDPAAALLAAVPVSGARRRLLRLGLAGCVAVPLWLFVTSALPGAGTALAPLAALAATGLAVATWLPSEGQATLAASVPLVWVAVGELFKDLDGPLHVLTRAWSSHSFSVVALGLVLVVLGRQR